LCYNSRCYAANIEPATPPKGFIKLAFIRNGSLSNNVFSRKLEGLATHKILEDNNRALVKVFLEKKGSKDGFKKGERT